MPIRITGLNSGLDTEAIISALVSSYSYKTDKYKKAQTKLSWKQDAWKTLNTKIYSLYTSLDSLRFSKNYNLKATTVSDTTKATVTAGSTAPNGTQTLNVLQVAQAGYLTGGKLNGSTTTGTTLAELGYTGGDGEINLTMGDGTTKSIKVTQGTTVKSFIDSLKEAGVSANYDETNHRIYVSSAKTGASNDFTLTGANVDGANALNKLGLNVESDATKATYTSYTKYYGDGTQIEANVLDAIQQYADAKAAYEKASAQNANLSASYSYATAYSAMMDALQKTGMSETEQKKLQTLLGMTATERVNSVMDADGNVYTKKTTDASGNEIYSYKDDAGNEKLIQKVVTYTGSDNRTYTLNADKTYTDEDGKVWKASSEKDADGNTYYTYTADDGTEEKITISSETTYYEATTSEKATGFYKITDADGNVYTQTDIQTADGLAVYSDEKGNQYALSADGTTLNALDADGNIAADGAAVAVPTDGRVEITETVYNQGAQLSDVMRSADKLTELKEASGLDDDGIKTLTSNISAVNSYESVTDNVLSDDDAYTRANIAAAIKEAYANGYADVNGTVGTGATGVTNLVNTYAAAITANKAVMEDGQKTMDDNSALATIAAMEDGTEKDEAVAAFVQQVQAAHDITESTSYNTDAKKIDGQDAIIKLNGIEYQSASSSFSINGLSITAQAVTGDGDDNAITITTATDTQGIYDKVKDFLTQYNALINEITSLYNADSAKGYEPLTDDEKDAMSDTEIEKWEEKIKSSLLRRDDSLESIMNAMTSSMSKGINVGGKTYYLSSFGIKTLGYLNAPENEQYAYHIDGDEDDTSTSGNTDKLMAAITSDPDTVIEFMQGLANNLYTAIGDKMKSTTLSSVYKVYNDKEMASEYSDYTDLIKKWEEKLQSQEDYYYEKFSAMETALSKLNSQTSSLTSLFGG